MVQRAGRSTPTNNALSTTQQEPAASNKKTTKQTVQELAKDGDLSQDDLAAIAKEIGGIEHPRERAHRAKEAREAIRSDENLSPQQRREAVRDLNKLLAKESPAWSQRPQVASTEDTQEASGNAAEASATQRVLEGVESPTTIDPQQFRAKNAEFLLTHRPIVP